MSKHYIRVDENDIIVKGFSDDFEIPQDNDICINEEAGRQFELNGVINPAIINEKNVYLFKYIDGQVINRTNEEILNDMQPKLADVKQSKIIEIETSYNQSLENGFVSSANGQTYSFGYGTSDRLKFLELAQSLTLGILPFPVSIPTKDNQIAVYTQEQYGLFIQNLGGFALTQHNKYHELLTQIQECSSINEVNAIVW